MQTSRFVKSVSVSKLFISTAAMVMVAVAAYNWAVRPRMEYLYAAQNYETMLSNAGQKTVIIKNRIKIKESKLDELRNEVSEIEESFFTSKRAREFFSDLEPIALQCKCDIDSLSSMPVEHVKSDGDKKTSSDIVIKRAAITLSGKYKNIIEFLEKLGSYSQRISIEELLIESSPSVNGSLACYITIAIYQIEDKEHVTNE